MLLLVILIVAAAGGMAFIAPRLGSSTKPLTFVLGADSVAFTFDGETSAVAFSELPPSLGVTAVHLGEKSAIDIPVVLVPDELRDTYSSSTLASYVKMSHGMIDQSAPGMSIDGVMNGPSLTIAQRQARQFDFYGRDRLQRLFAGFADAVAAGHPGAYVSANHLALLDGMSGSDRVRELTEIIDVMLDSATQYEINLDNAEKEIAQPVGSSADILEIHRAERKAVADMMSMSPRIGRR